MSNSVTVKLKGDNDELEEVLADSTMDVEEFKASIRHLMDVAKQAAGEDAFNDSLEELGDQLDEVQDDLHDVEESVDDLAKETKSGFHRMGDAAKTFGRVVSGAVTAALLATPLALVAVVGKVGGAIWDLASRVLPFLTGAADEAQQGMRQTEILLKNTGNAAGFTSDQLDKLAERTEKTTTFNKEAARAAQNLMLAYTNIRGDVFVRAQTAAQDLATALGTDLKEAAKKVAESLEDPVNKLSGLEEAGVFFTQQQKDLVKQMVETGDVMGAQNFILDELSSRYGGSAADKVNTFSGRMQQIYNRVMTAAAGIGESLNPAIDALTPVLDAALNLLERSAPAISTFAAMTIKGGLAWAKNLTPYLMAGVDALNLVASTVEVAGRNYDKVINLMVLRTALFAETNKETIKDLLTRQLPAYTEWLKRNWFNLLTDMGSAWATGLSNMGRNFAKFWNGLQNLITTGSFGELHFTPLLEGFESTLEELPRIAERELSATEGALQREIDRTNEALGEAIAATMQRNENAVRSLFEVQEQEAIDLANTASDNFDQFITDAKAEADKAKTEVEATRRINAREKTKDGGGDKGGEKDTIAAGFDDLESLAKRIESSQGGDPAKEVARHREQDQRNAEVEHNLLDGILQGVHAFGREAAIIGGNVAAGDPRSAVERALAMVGELAIGSGADESSVKKVASGIDRLVGAAENVVRNLPLVGAYK